MDLQTHRPDAAATLASSAVCAAAPLAPGYPADEHVVDGDLSEHDDRPLGHALVGADEGDEVEVLVGNLAREAVIDRVIKRGGRSGDVTPEILS